MEGKPNLATENRILTKLSLKVKEKLRHSQKIKSERGSLPSALQQVLKGVLET